MNEEGPSNAGIRDMKDLAHEVDKGYTMILAAWNPFASNLDHRHKRIWRHETKEHCGRYDT